MDEVKDSFVVYFEDPFWVGVLERWHNNKLSVCKVTFGPEPKEYEVYELLNKEFYHFKFSPTIEASNEKINKINPKRVQRQARKELEQKGIGTKSQQALKEQQELNKQTRKEARKKRSEEEKEHQFELKKQKRKEKHRGR